MTSKNSSSLKTLRELLRSRIWALALSFILFFLYDAVGTIANILRSHNFAEVYRYSAAQRRSEALAEVSKWLGVRQYFGWTAVIFLAVVAGISGFAWMDSRQKIDFYESLPVKRSARFRQIVLSGILVFLIPGVLCLAAGLLIAAGMGVMTSAIVWDAWYELLRLFILYLGVFAISTLAAMWTGNVIIAVIADAVLLLIGKVTAVLAASLKSMFFFTYYATGQQARDIFSPIDNYRLLALPFLFGDDVFSSSGLSKNYGVSTMNYLHACVGAAWKYDLLSLAVTAFVLWLAYISYKKRRNEDAGMAVVFAPVRIVTKLVISIIGGLSAGLVVASLFASSQSHSTAVICIIFIIIAVMILCAVIQIIYDFNFRSCMKGAWAMAVSGILAVALFLMFRSDVFGYDSYIPREDAVDSAAVANLSDMTMYFDENGTPVYDSVKAAAKYMKLTDISDVTALARYGQAYTAAEEKGQRDAADASAQVYNLVVLYRMKDGRKIYRQFDIPTDTEASLLDSITGSEEYHEGYFNFRNARGYFDSTMTGTISYTSEWDQEAGLTPAAVSDDQYDSLKQALLEDTAQYCYSMASEEQVIGKVIISRRQHGDPETGETGSDAIDSSALSNNSNGDSLMINIYPSYSNTIQWLKKEGLWVEPVPDAADVMSVEVYDYDSADLLGKTNEEMTDQDYNVYAAVIYTDEDRVKEILENACNSYGTSGEWFVYPEGDAGDCYLTAELTNGKSVTLNFKKEEAPEFVSSDLRNNIMSN